MNMDYTFTKFENKFIVSIKNRKEISNVISSFCSDLNIKAGAIIGIGAIDNATLRFFDPATKKYVDKSFNEQMEIANLTGNISTLNNDVYIHLHATLGRADYSAIAGHLLTATLSGAGEFIIEAYDIDLKRKYDDEIGLNVYDF